MPSSSRGWQVEIPFFAEPRSELFVERLALRGRGVRLAVELETDEAGRTGLAALDRPRESVAVPLGLGERRPARLLLRVEGGSGEPGAGVVLRGGSLRAPRGRSEAGGAIRRRRGAQPRCRRPGAPTS